MFNVTIFLTLRLANYWQGMTHAFSTSGELQRNKSHSRELPSLNNFFNAINCFCVLHRQRMCSGKYAHVLQASETGKCTLQHSPFMEGASNKLHCWAPPKPVANTAVSLGNRHSKHSRPRRIANITFSEVSGTSDQSRMLYSAETQQRCMKSPRKQQKSNANCYICKPQPLEVYTYSKTI